MSAIQDSPGLGTGEHNPFWFEAPAVTPEPPEPEPAAVPQPAVRTAPIETLAAIAPERIQIRRVAPAPRPEPTATSFGDTGEFTSRWTEAWHQELREAQRRRPPRRRKRAARQLVAVAAAACAVAGGAWLAGHMLASSPRHQASRPSPERTAAIAIAPHSPASAYAKRTIPEAWLRMYWQAGAEYGLDWTILAAVGTIESDNGQSVLPGVSSGTNSAGAAGPAQFENSTWARYGVNADGTTDSGANPYNADDAITTMAAYLKASGAPQNWTAALYAYNQSVAYGQAVLALAQRYRG